MDADLKAKWIALLRSGNYQQCFGKMYEVWDPVGNASQAFCAVGLFREHLSVQEWYALQNDPEGYRMTGYVFGWNDKDRLSFPEIADRLEAMA